MSLSRSVYRYQSKEPDNTHLEQTLIELAKRYPRYGFRKMFHTLRNQGNKWNHKKVYRVYRQLKLNLKSKVKKRLPTREKRVLLQPKAPNKCWSLDYMSDALISGRRFRTANMIDDYNRGVIAIKISFSLPAKHITQWLDTIGLQRGFPEKIRVDNGPENIARVMKLWAQARGIQLEYIQPGKPAQNGYIERLNRTYREDVLDMYTFRNLEEVQRITKDWIYHYNNKRPHASLGNITPVEFLKANNFSTFELY